MPHDPAAQVGDGLLHGAQARLEAELPLQIRAHDIAITAVLEEANLKALRMLVQTARPAGLPIRLPATLA